jgi:hypothetical protein
MTPTLSTSPASFETFPARAYIEKYYAEVGSENAALLGALTSFARELEPRLERVVEVGGGPIVLSILALSAACGRRPDRVVFGDIAPANLAEVRSWLRGDPDSFDYRAALDWLREREGVEPAVLVETVRAAHWDVRRMDLREPIPGELEGRFDTVSSHFFADSATADPAEFEDFLAKIGRLAAPGARLFLSFMARSTGYGITGYEYPAVSLDPECLLGHLARAGLSLGHFRLHTTPTEGLPSETGYEGLMFLAGTLER